MLLSANLFHLTNREQARELINNIIIIPIIIIIIMIIIYNRTMCAIGHSLRTLQCIKNNEIIFLKKRIISRKKLF